MSAVSDQKAINLWTIWMAALAVVLLWAAYLVRDVLLLIYMSGLLAVGLQPDRPADRAPAIPALSARAAFRDGWRYSFSTCSSSVRSSESGFWSCRRSFTRRSSCGARCRRCSSGHRSSWSQKGLLRERLTIQEAVERAPVSKGGDAVTTVFGAIAGVVGGLFGFLTILILTFYLLVEADHAACVAAAALCRRRGARAWTP